MSERMIARPREVELTRFWRWRTNNGLTAAEVSDLTGLSPSMISRLERGERQLSALTKVMVARRLNVPVRELFDPDPLPEAVEAS